MKTLLNISKINIKLTLILSVLVLLWSLDSNASVYGILKGKVLDSDGKPAIGGTVRVLGTTRGAKVKETGEFTIVNILAGKYKIKVGIHNHQNYYKDITIIADSTIELFSINLEKRYEGYIDNLEMLDTLNRTNFEGITSTARFGINQMVSLSAGVTQNSSCCSIRSNTETQVRVDGIDVNNQFIGHGYSYESVNVNSKEHVLLLMDKIHLKGKVGILDNLVPIQWIK